MKVTLVRLQLRRRHILNGDRVVSGIGNDGVPMGVVMHCRKKRVHACKDLARCTAASKRTPADGGSLLSSVLRRRLRSTTPHSGKTL